MKSFRHFIREQEEDFGHHLPSITIHDSHGEAHQAPFHSEIEGGTVRYDLTDALAAVKQKGAFFKLAHGSKMAEKQLSDHHGRKFTGDLATKGGANLAKHGVMLLSFTPEGGGGGGGGGGSSGGGGGPTKGRAILMPVSGGRSVSSHRPHSMRTART